MLADEPREKTAFGPEANADTAPRRGHALGEVPVVETTS
jgi:hypothetical protein